MQVETKYYVRVIARLPPAEPAAAWMRESVDIIARSSCSRSIKVESERCALPPGYSGNLLQTE